jgi:PqqD family protein of HPr-rel-A system
MLDDCVISLPEGGLVCGRFWEDESVVYNQLSGETHLIVGIGAQVFKFVSEKAITRNVLLQNLQRVFELETDFDMEELLDNLILQYQKLGLLAVTENNSA